MRIAFVDSATQSGYSASSVDDSEARIGGTEKTVIHIAVALARHHVVTVVQPAAGAASRNERGVRWTSSGREELGDADVIVCVRRISDLIRARKHNRRAKMYVWYHDWFETTAPGQSLRARSSIRFRSIVRALIHGVARADAITVSHTHAANLEASLAETRLGAALARRTSVIVIYNPTPEVSLASGEVVQPNKLLFFSSPTKGLDHVIEAFREVRRSCPDLTLSVAAPGYASGSNDRLDEPGVEVLGTLAGENLHREIKTSLCVFYPAKKVPETFGLVFTESHALGTPVMACPFGAAEEFLSSAELVAFRDYDGMAHRLRFWQRGGRPKVTLADELKASSVVRSWQRLVEDLSA